MSNASENTLFSFLVNDDFINYVVNPTLILSEMWDDFFRINPELIQPANEAKAILLGENPVDTLPDTDKNFLFDNILSKCKSQHSA